MQTPVPRLANENKSQRLVLIPGFFEGEFRKHKYRYKKRPRPKPQPYPFCLCELADYSGGFRWMILLFVSNVPCTVTFLPSNFCTTSWWSMS
jgi:hypothetical protein